MFIAGTPLDCRRCCPSRVFSHTLFHRADSALGPCSIGWSSSAASQASCGSAVYSRPPSAAFLHKEPIGLRCRRCKHIRAPRSWGPNGSASRTSGAKTRQQRADKASRRSDHYICSWCSCTGIVAFLAIIMSFTKPYLQHHKFGRMLSPPISAADYAICIPSPDCNESYALLRVLLCLTDLCITCRSRLVPRLACSQNQD